MPFNTALEGTTAHADLDEALRRFRTEQGPEKGQFPREVDEILAVVHDRLFEPDLSVEALRERCRITDNNVSSRFRFATGLTIKGYIQALRMEAAAMLLREHSSAVVDISHAIGFNYPQTFYRAFQSCFQCTPSAYRERARQ